MAYGGRIKTPAGTDNATFLAGMFYHMNANNGNSFIVEQIETSKRALIGNVVFVFSGKYTTDDEVDYEPTRLGKVDFVTQLKNDTEVNNHISFVNRSISRK